MNHASKKASTFSTGGSKKSLPNGILKRVESTDARQALDDMEPTREQLDLETTNLLFFEDSNLRKDSIIRDKRLNHNSGHKVTHFEN